MSKTDTVKNLSLQVGDHKLEVNEDYVIISEVSSYSNGSSMSLKREQFLRIVNVLKAALE